MERKLPIGVQDFGGLRRDGYIYVDKTEYIYKLVHTGKQYFLSRPRRFGKSLLLSTLRAYWEGKKELFSGLMIDQLEQADPNAWTSYPVFLFDFNGANYLEQNALEGKLSFQLREWEERYVGGQRGGDTLSERFQTVLRRAYEQTGHRCVVLVDEYDKPLLDVADHPELQEHNKAVFKGFFSVLKSRDEYIKFVFITGVTKFHKVSIFSDLNQLNDISLNEDYAGACGITQKEILQYFSPEVERLAKRRNLTNEECMNKLQEWYDGYHFNASSEGVYNPFSLLKAFYEKKFGSYWFATGTPTCLVKQLTETSFDVRKFSDQTIYASDSVLTDYTGEGTDPVPLLYQSGYLPITDYDESGSMYTLSFPNREVKYGFLESLMPEYVSDCGAGSGRDIFTLREYAEKGDLDGMRDLLTALFANITYTLASDPFEHYFQAVIYLTFTLLGKFTHCEMHTYTGRIDCKVETRDYIYLFEFKCDKSADEALRQIDDKDYALPFIADHRKLYKIGVNFDSADRKLVDWKVAE